MFVDPCAGETPDVSRAVLWPTILLSVASTLDKDKLHGVLDEAVVVIDAEAFERSKKDPRVHELFKRGEALHAELDAKNANF